MKMIVQDASEHADDSHPVIELLLVSQSLLRFARGDRRKYFMSKWVAAANWVAFGLLGRDPVRIPQSPKAAVRMLFQHCMELGEAAGISRAELADAFNLRAESGAAAVPGDIETPIDRMFGVLLLLLAEKRKVD